MHPLSIILILTLVVTWVRLFRPVHKNVEGNTIRVAPLPLLAKIRMHSVPSVLALILSVGLVLTGNLAWWALAIPIASTILLLSIPVEYTITDEGIRLGWTEFRRWTEFAGVRRAPFGARLLGVSGKRGMNIWLSGSRDDDDFLHFLRQTQKNAYKGRPAAIQVLDAERQTILTSHPDAPQQQIAAFTTTDHL
jgi:hypothetical protein